MSVYFDQFLMIAPALVPLMIVVIAFAFHFLPAEITDHTALSIGRFLGRFLIGPLAALMAPVATLMAPVAALIALFAAIALLIWLILAWPIYAIAFATVVIALRVLTS